MWKWAKDRHGKSSLHYDHNDTNTGYLGFSHGNPCNLRAGASKGARVANARRKARRTHAPRYPITHLPGTGTPGPVL